ncbi:hypothetical protein [Porphyromonas sp.]|uniref:hypothetical protein n=1 Tax=Porphyromonas sp. TaxID=1924944 RepID=UPI0026DB2D9E|nr:hypothetical protein [Porphyromonas sp.]MDO4695476.1 hypothetical protein [Porphyromonas sp.]MDO4770290.1 hypothetical protein [Porphyromonas sp.]
MAVSNIRKASSWTLLIVAIISVIVFALFFLGGVVNPAAAKPEPVYTGALLYWGYIVCGLAVLALVLFSLLSFGSQFKANPKKALLSLGIIVAFILLLVVTYNVGSPDPLHLGQDFQKYNEASWLKTADMWLYSIYALLGFSFIAVIWGAVKSFVSKR